MTPYFCLLMCSLLFSHVSFSGKKQFCLSIGNNEYIQNNNLGMSVFFLILIFLVACRSVAIGNDTENYETIFNEYSHQNFAQIVSESQERLYGVLNWMVGKLFGNFQIFLVITAIVSILPLAQLYCEDKKHCYLKVVIFLNLSTFCLLFSGIRQCIAIAMGVIAFKYVREKKILKYILCILLAFGFHRSSFILCALYPIYHLKIRKIHLSIVIPIGLFIMMYNQQIFGFLTQIMNLISDRYELISSSQTNAYSVLILFVALALFTYIVPQESMITSEIVGYRNILLLTVYLQCFASVHVLAMRMNYYFMVFIPIAVGKVMDFPKEKYKSIMKFSEIIMCIFFTVYFIITIIVANSTGGNLHTVPYSSFWTD